MDIIDNDRYLIYDDGRVWSKYYKKFLKPYCGSNNGRNRGIYLRVMLCKKTWKIHRLVALHYVPNPDKERYPMVDHIDRNTLNNHYTNLRWVNASMNSQNQDVRKNNKLGIKNIHYHATNKQYIFKKRINGLDIRKSFKTLEEAIQYKEEFLKSVWIIQDTADIPPDVERTSAPLDP